MRSYNPHLFLKQSNLKNKSRDNHGWHRKYCLRNLKLTKVGNFWFLYPLVLSKWEDLAFSVSRLLEKSVFILQFLNDKMHNYVKQNITKNFNIKKLNKFSLRELSFLSFEESVFIFQFLNNKTHKCIKQNIIVHFIIQKLKNEHTFLQNYTNWES